ncbi:testis-expressed protein 2 isoform X4 [Phyllopteryx taeniolatus]|uniref:testis-expressed protein 2 isoform X4 n=1 Tax=Phyllopteryx taeniolatus TaxID=161469 RepID=UPI002AD5A971|nr:testis-expressed protein 2 isoform X4 [Phyllopteryx taeniolatus]
MAESGNNWAQGCEEDASGGGRPLLDTHSPDVVPNSLGTKRHLPRGIVIQLTGTEGEWSSLDESELIFSLDHDEYYSSVSQSSQKQISSDDDRGSQSQAFHVPLSPSSPGSLGNFSATSPTFLSPGSSSPTHQPLASLVKSLSTELELRESSTLRPKPLLSLVKSISTELSRSEPEVSQSKSDSRLNLHLLKQLTQPKNRRSGDSRTAPPSPSMLSPTGEGLKGGFFKMELEDTKRKLSEAVHEPLSSMLNKIRREDSTGSPKHLCKTTQGWMNEIHDYCPETYHSSQTHSVFATLEGSCLRLDTPQSNINRRATYDERVNESTFIKMRSYQLEKSKVFLLPSVLARKRLWNPKYPICIQLASDVNSQEEAGQWSEESQDEEEEPRTTPASSCQGFAEPIHDPPTTLYLFGRTGREKEEWFRYFLLASTDADREKDQDKSRPGRCVPRSGDPVLSQAISSHSDIPCSRGSSRVGSSEDDAPSMPAVALSQPSSSSTTTRGLLLLDYARYMSRLLTTEDLLPFSSPGVGSTETSPKLKGNCTCDLVEYTGRSPSVWLNALIGRIFWDFLREKHWADMVSHKIQKKLSTIRLPYFMNELTLTELDMGCSIPQIISTSQPEVNHRGLWVELQLAYYGTLQMTLQTKFNLSKLGKEGGQDTDWLTETGNTRCRPILSVLADSDEESSSAASSEDEEVLLAEPQGPSGEKGLSSATDGTGGGRTGRKILRFVDKIAKSRYFQKATENEFIKKKFEEMSNTPLLLTVEVQELSGSLVVNIPPPPTDRIWYSFCKPPKLDLRVRPKLGEREVTLCHVTEWIEKKLQNEFQKVFVLPNMDDIYLPMMHSGVDSPRASEHLSSQSQSSTTESIERIPQEVTSTESNYSTALVK